MDSVYYFIGHIGLELNHLLCVWERGGLWGCRLSNGHKRHSYGRTFRISASRTPPIKLDKCWYRQKSTPNNWYQWNGKKWICDGSATQRNLWPSQCNIWIYHCREEWISKLYNPTAKKKCVVRTKESFLFSFRVIPLEKVNISNWMWSIPIQYWYIAMQAQLLRFMYIWLRPSDPMSSTAQQWSHRRWTLRKIAQMKMSNRKTDSFLLHWLPSLLLLHNIKHWQVNFSWSFGIQFIFGFNFQRHYDLTQWILTISLAFDTVIILIL